MTTPRRKPSNSGGSRSGKSRSGQPGSGKGQSSGGSKGTGGSRGSGGSGRKPTRGSSGKSERYGAKGGQPKGASGRSGGSKGRDGKGAGRGDGAKRGEARGAGRSSGDAKYRNQAVSHGSGPQRRRRDLKGAAVDLPTWVIEDLSRTTPNHRIADALEELGEAGAAFGDGRFQKALRHALRAKELAPRDATVREVLALSAYRTGDWKQALRELRTYRRLSGELTHIPIEMDVLRALDKGDEVPKAWQLLQDHGSKPAVVKEARVVYASYLIDEGKVKEAREVVAPGRLSDRPFDEDLRLWYVAARAAAIDGDGIEARRLRNAILVHDAAFPGIDELEKLMARLP